MPNNIRMIWEKLLEEFDFTKEINNNLKSNKIKVWTKLNLPSINSINQIRKIVESDSNGYIKRYQEEETNIRDLIQPGDIIEDDDENEEEVEEKKILVNEFFMEENNNIEDPKFENVKEEINKFFIPNNQVINFLKNQIEKDIFIKSFESENREEIIDLFFQDYYSQFITSIIHSEDIIYFKVLQFLTELRFGQKIENMSIIYYSKSILWTYIYKDELIFLLKNFGIIKEIFPDIDFLEKVKQKIDSKEIDYIISSHHPRHKKLIDKAFLLVLDSFYFNLIELIETLSSPKVLEIIDALSEILQNGEIYNTNLKLKSKDFYRFKTLFISIKLFNDKNAYDKEKINEYISHIKTERCYLLENRMEQVSEEIKIQIEFLLNNLPDCEEKTKTIMKILISKYKEITDIGCREILCSIVLKDDKLIKISNEFFIHILDSFSFIPESLEPSDDSDNPFSKSAANHKLLKIINEKRLSKILKENLKYIFKFKILQYYKEKLKKTFDAEDERIREEIAVYLGEDSLNYFRNAHNTLIEINKAEEIEIPNKNIKEVFCFVYCCIFLENFVKYTISQITLVSGRKTEIIEFLNEGNSEIKETFKLFILKELKTKYITERTQFLNIDKWTDDYNLKDLFKDLNFEKSNNKEIHGSLSNLFFGGYSLEELNSEKILRGLVVNRYHALNEKTFLCNIDLFINENLSTLKTEEGLNLCKNSSLMKCFNSYVNIDNQFSNSTRKLINLFFDNDIYTEKLCNIINETNYFEILLYAYRFSIMSSMAAQNSIYSKMIKENCIQEINNAYIPGADLYCDLWVESYFNMLEPIKKNSDDSGYCNGYYICDCGEYYFQQYCGVPVDITFCANCYKKIGGLNEKLVIREENNGEYKIMRIYPSENNKRNVQDRGDLQSIYGTNFENGYPNKLFSEYENEMIEKMNNNFKGILGQNYLFFINETKKIRNLKSDIF